MVSDLEPQIIVAGASGYIGQAVIPELLAKFPRAQITALSRAGRPIAAAEDSRVHWKRCDLFSLKDLEQALPARADLALYLVHSMGPTAQLDQGSFSDYDLILADNFARSAKRIGVRQLIYLGGLIPEGGPLSLHLRSRLEVEQTFSDHRVPITTLRAGLIMGEGGSSFQILLKLLERLPILVCPLWMKTLTTPVDLRTVLNTLCATALAPEHVGKIYDLAGCAPLTYLEMMRQTAEQMGRPRIFWNVPYYTPIFSHLWVSLITNAPRNLVRPLIESLEHPMVARATHFFSAAPTRTYRELLNQTALHTIPSGSQFRFRPHRKTVRSVQRLPLPVGRSAEWVMAEYVHWLPRFLAPLIKVRLDHERVTFSVLTKRLVLLELNRSHERSTPDRQLLYIHKGLLVAEENRGRLEFRVVLGRRYVLAAIHDYRPALPWFVYKFTQAILHLWIMRAFGRRLSKT